MSDYRQQQEAEEEYLALLLEALSQANTTCTYSQMLLLCAATGVNYTEVFRATNG
jgi:hypothetical protein